MEVEVEVEKKRDYGAGIKMLRLVDGRPTEIQDGESEEEEDEGDD